MRPRSWKYGIALLAAALAACGSVTPKQQDAAPPDDAAIDAPIDAPDRIDAGIDAPVGSGAELGAGGGRMTGGTFTLDVQLGHPVGQQPITGPTLRLEGNAPIKP